MNEDIKVRQSMRNVYSVGEAIRIQRARKVAVAEFRARQALASLTTKETGNEHPRPF